MLLEVSLGQAWPFPLGLREPTCSMEIKRTIHQAANILDFCLQSHSTVGKNLLSEFGYRLVRNGEAYSQIHVDSSSNVRPGVCRQEPHEVAV